MIDTITIDCLTLLQFKNYEAREQWSYLIKHSYYSDHDMEIAMDFARRWGKLMQYLLKNDLKNFDDIVSLCAHDANVEHNLTGFHAEKALNLLISLWKHGDALQNWADNGGRDIIKHLFL